jgi:hypothetical protein
MEIVGQNIRGPALPSAGPHLFLERTSFVVQDAQQFGILADQLVLTRLAGSGTPPAAMMDGGP